MNARLTFQIKGFSPREMMRLKFWLADALMDGIKVMVIEQHGFGSLDDPIRRLPCSRGSTNASFDKTYWKWLRAHVGQPVAVVSISCMISWRRACADPMKIEFGQASRDRCVTLIRENWPLELRIHALDVGCHWMLRTGVKPDAWLFRNGLVSCRQVVDAGECASAPAILSTTRWYRWRWIRWLGRIDPDHMIARLAPVNQTAYPSRWTAGSMRGALHTDNLRQTCRNAITTGQASPAFDEGDTNGPLAPFTPFTERVATLYHQHHPDGPPTGIDKSDR